MPPMPKRPQLLPAVALWLAACATAPPRPPEPPPVAPSLVGRVPAEASWVVVVPEVTREGFAAALEPLTTSAEEGQPLVAELVSRLLVDGAVPEGVAELDRWSRILARAAELVAPETLAAFGVGSPTAFVAHGGPDWPVLRLLLADPGRARSALAELLTGVAGVTREEVAPGVVTWLATIEDLRVRVGVVDDQLVVALSPTALGGVSSAVFAAPVAAAPSAVSGALEHALRKTGGRRDLAVGWVRSGRLALAGMDYYLATLGPDDPAEAEELAVCRREVGRLLEGLPDYLFSYRSFTADASSFAVVMDLDDPELAGAVAAVGDGGVSLAVEPFAAPDVALSLSLDVGKLGDLLGLLARRMAAESYTCEQVREVGDWLASTSLQMGVSGRLLLGGFHALHVRVIVPEGADPMDVAAGQMVAVAVHDAPEQLVSMLKSFGQIDLELPPEGETRTLGEGESLVLGRSGRLTGIGYGPDAAGGLSQVLAGGPGGAAPLLTYAANGGFGDDYLGLLELVDEALRASTSFPDGARVAGAVVRVGDKAIDAAAAYRRATVLEASGWDMPPETLLSAAIDQLLERELVMVALRRLREPTLAERGERDDAQTLVRRRMERRKKLRFSRRRIEARYRELVAGVKEPPALDDALTGEIVHDLERHAVAAETQRLVSAQAKRTQVIDERARATETVAKHWAAVWELRDTLAAKLRAISADERVETTLQVRDGMLELLGATRKENVN